MDNIYVMAMEYGSNNLNGFLYPDIKKWIEEKRGEKLNFDTEFAFVDWFVNSFSSHNFMDSNKGVYNKDIILNAYRQSGSHGVKERFNKSVWVMAGQTNKQYIDYLELKESREHAQKAFKTSFWSIIIASISLVVSVIFFFLAAKPQLPPYEVKIIENKVDDSKQRFKIDSLRNELHEAEMLLESFEKFKKIEG